MAGNGTLTLTGANTYSGQTNINAGTLSVANASALGTGNAMVASGGALNIDGVTVINALTLSGNGTGTGALTGTGSAAVDGPITLAANTTIGAANSGDTLTVGGAIGDGGNGYALTTTGDGTVALAGANTYTGTTNIDGGTLALISGGSIANSTGVNLNNEGATLDMSGASNPETVQALSGVAGSTVALGANTLIDTGASSSFGGTIEGTGGLVKTGSSTLTLTGANTYTGQTDIGGGTLAFANAGSIAQSTGVNLTNGATLDISRASGPETVQALSGDAGTTVNLGANGLTDTGASSIFAGTIEGTGGLTVSGPGVVLMLTGDNTFTGGSYVADGGQLVVTPSGSIVGQVTSNGDTVFTGADTRTLTNTLTGHGTLYQVGSGMLTINGNQSGFTGTTYIQSGSMQVGDAANPGTVLGGDVLVEGSGLVRGHGTIGGDVTNDGNVFPGGSIGILTVKGNYTQMADGTLNIEVTPLDGRRCRLRPVARERGGDACRRSRRPGRPGQLRDRHQVRCRHRGRWRER